MFRFFRQSFFFAFIGYLFLGLFDHAAWAEKKPDISFTIFDSSRGDSYSIRHWKRGGFEDPDYTLIRSSLRGFQIDLLDWTGSAPTKRLTLVRDGVNPFVFRLAPIPSDIDSSCAAFCDTLGSRIVSAIALRDTPTTSLLCLLFDHLELRTLEFAGDGNDEKTELHTLTIRSPFRKRTMSFWHKDTRDEFFALENDSGLVLVLATHATNAALPRFWVLETELALFRSPVFAHISLLNIQIFHGLSSMEGFKRVVEQVIAVFDSAEQLLQSQSR